MGRKTLQLFVTTVLAVLLTTQTQGGPLGEFPIKTFPRVLSDVTRIFSEAREEMGEARSWLQAITSRLANAAPDPREDVRTNGAATAGLKCQRYQLAFDGSATICVDVEFKGVFDDIAHVVTGGSIRWPNRDDVLEMCAKQGGWVAQDGADTSEEAAEFAADEGTGKAHEVEINPERIQKFEQESSEDRVPKRRREINEEQNLAKAASEVGGGGNEDSQTESPSEIKISDEDSIIKNGDKTNIFITCLKNRFNMLTPLIPMITLNEHTRKRRGSPRKGPVPRIIISLSF